MLLPRGGWRVEAERRPPSLQGAGHPRPRPIRPQGRQCRGRETLPYPDAPSCQASLTNRLGHNTAFSISPFPKPPLLSLNVELMLSPPHPVSTLDSFTVTSLRLPASRLHRGCQRVACRAPPSPVHAAHCVPETPGRPDLPVLVRSSSFFSGPQPGAGGAPAEGPSSNPPASHVQIQTPSVLTSSCHLGPENHVSPPSPPNYRGP